MRFNLRNKLILYSIILAIVPLGFASQTLIRITQDELKSSVNDSISTTAEQIAKDIDDWYSDTWLAPLLLITNGVDNPLLGPNEKLSFIQAGLQTITDVVACEIHVVGMANPILITKDDFTDRLAKQGLDANEILMLNGQQIETMLNQGSEVITGRISYIPETDDWLLPVVIPLQNPIAGQNAVFVAQLNLNRLHKFIQNHSFQRTGSVILVNQAGERLFDPEHTSLKEYSLVQDIMRLMQSQSRAIGVKHYMRPDGTDYLAGFAFPEYLNMAVMVERKVDDAYLAIDKMLQTLTTITIIVLGFVILGALYFSLRISRPVERITRVAQEVGSGKLDQEIKVHESSDELGILSANIKHMRDAIRSKIEDLNALIQQLRQHEAEINSLNQELQEKNIIISKTSEAYSRFFPHEFLQHLNRKHVTELQLGDSIQRTMPILFSDLRSFTTHSEGMTPEENFRFLNSYLTQMGPCIRMFRGFVDKYIGDAIMALFESADDAVAAAVTMFNQLAEYNQGRARAGYFEVKMGIGIHMGSMMLGTIGEHERMETTVISDTVNLASRLEGMTKLYGVNMLISDAVFYNLRRPDDFKSRIIDQVRAKGKKEPVTIFEIYSGDPPQQIVLKDSSQKLVQEGIANFHLGQLEAAKMKFEQCLRIFPEDKVATIYLERCEYYLKVGLDSNWDGVTDLTQK